MPLFTFRLISRFSKKTRKHLIILIVVSLLHNFIVFPARAAADPVELLSVSTNYQIIKSPESDINLREELTASPNTPLLTRKIDTRTELAKNFKVIEKYDSASLMDIYKKNTVEIATLNKASGQRLVTMTAYNSEVAQTDGDPCTTANGFNVCDHGIEDTVAANFLPFGTKIMVPELFGDRIFVVRDRTARRFSDRVDIWMLKKSDALKFGIRQAQIVVVE